MTRGSAPSCRDRQSSFIVSRRSEAAFLASRGVFPRKQVQTVSCHPACFRVKAFDKHIEGRSRFWAGVCASTDWFNRCLSIARNRALSGRLLTGFELSTPPRRPCVESGRQYLDCSGVCLLYVAARVLGGGSNGEVACCSGLVFILERWRRGTTQAIDGDSGTGFGLFADPRPSNRPCDHHQRSLGGYGRRVCLVWHRAQLRHV